MGQTLELQRETLPAGSLLAQIISETNITPNDEGYDAARLGIGAVIEEMLKPVNAEEKIRKPVVDRMIADIDRRLSAFMDNILHHEDFQSMESAWRGLKLLVDRTDTRENIFIEVLNVTKDELMDDFLDASEINQSNLYKQIYTAEYGQFGGQPVGTMIGNYYFGPSAMDMRLLEYIAQVATVSHAPFITAASPEFFGLKGSFERLPRPQGSPGYFQRHPLHQMAILQGIRRQPVCWSYRAAVPAPPALRSRRKPYQGFCLQRERRRQPCEFPLGQYRVRLCHPHNGEFCQLPVGRQYYRPPVPAARWRICPSICTKVWAILR
jgi:predicted component of type VI protein secretion system